MAKDDQALTIVLLTMNADVSKWNFVCCLMMISWPANATFWVVFFGLVTVRVFSFRFALDVVAALFKQAVGCKKT